MSTAMIERLSEQRQRAWDAMKATLDKAESENRDLTVEERTAFDQGNAELDELRGRLEAIAQAEARNAEAEKHLEALLGKREGGNGTEQRGKDVDVDELRSFLTGESDGNVRTGRRKGFEIRSAKPLGVDEFRTLSKLTAGAGANTVPTSFYGRLMAHMIEVSGILAAGPTLLSTNSGEQIQVPKTTAHSTAALIAEAGTITASDPVFGQVPLDAYKYAVLIQLSNELITDTGVDLEGYVAMQAGRAVGNAFGVHAITGTGTNQPNGLVTAASVGVTGSTGVAGAFTYDNLVDLFYSVIAPYRNSPSCGWMLKDSSMAVVRKMKDGAGNYIFSAGESGAPDRILNKPVNTDPNIAAPAVNAKSVIFGDVSQYFVRMVNGIRLERSDDFAFNTDLVTYRCIARCDGDLVDTTGAVKVFQGAAT